MTLAYTTGTVSVTNGSTTVTGVSTLWLSSLHVGDLFTLNWDAFYQVTAIASNTSLTLNRAYTGTTQSAQSYAVVRLFGTSTVADVAGRVAATMDKYNALADGGGSGKFADGTVALPGVAFSADLDTGFYRIGTNAIGVTVGGVKKMEINSTGIVGAVTGSADTLTTARTIALPGGATGTATSFNGSANITIPVTALDATTLTGTIASARLSGTYAISTTGSAATLTTGRTIALSGGVTGTATSFNGSANITIPVTSVNAANLSGTVPSTNLDADLVSVIEATDGVNNGLIGLNRTGDCGTAAFCDADVLTGVFERTTATALTLTENDRRCLVRVTANATVQLPVASDCSPGWHCWIKARGGTATVAIQGSDTIDGAATSLSLTTGTSAMIVCTSSGTFERV